MRSTVIWIALTTTVVAIAQTRPSVTPVLSVTAQTGLRPPDPACTCASVESFPAPSKYDGECVAGVACEEIHYAEYLARKALPDPLGTLRATHFVQSRVYDATVSFRARAGDSTFRVRVGDIIPTPRGRARVVQVYRSFVESWDDGRVVLRLLETQSSVDRTKIFVSSGAPSHVRGVAITMTHASGGVASLVVVDGTTRTLDVRRGDTIPTSNGSFHVVDVVDGLLDGPIGWVVVDP